MSWAFCSRKDETNDYRSSPACPLSEWKDTYETLTQMDPNRRQDPARAHSTYEPLVEYYSVCHASRTHDIRNALQGSIHSDRLRFH